MTDSHLVKSIAYHESGHIVVAAVLGRPLRSSGIHIDCVNRGIAFYAQRKPKVDYSGPCAGTKMDTMIAAYAGLPAQQIFYRECPVHCADGDEEFIRDLLASADDDDFADLHRRRCKQELSCKRKRWSTNTRL